MTHHKRKRSKNRRSGCLLCKPWKMNGFPKNSPAAARFSDHKRRTEAAIDLAAAYRHGITCRSATWGDVLHMKMDQISELWREHEAAPFPPDCRGEEIQGENLVLLDSSAAGCILTFRDARALDRQGYECLVGCRDGLAEVVPLLAGDARIYFERLGRLSELVLAELKSLSQAGKVLRERAGGAGSAD